jgi:hypothetical protein
VWLCLDHAKAVDDNEERFPAALLTGWRSAAEHIAQIEHGAGKSFDGLELRKLVRWERELPLGRDELREAVHAFLSDVGAPRAWGDHYDLVRMLIYQLALNAVKHGSARELRLASEDGVVTLADNGSCFALEDLRSSGQGGHRAVGDLERDAAGTFSLVQ